MAGYHISFRFPENINLDQLDKKAKEYGLSRTGLLLEGISLMQGFDPKIFSIIKEYADNLKIEPALVIQNILIDRFAKDEASFDVYGYPIQPLREFMFTSRGPVTGEALYKSLYDWHFKKFAQDYIDEINKRESYGVKLSAEALAFRDKYELKQNISQNDDMAKLVEQYPDMADEIKLNIELNRKKV